MIPSRIRLVFFTLFLTAASLCAQSHGADPSTTVATVPATDPNTTTEAAAAIASGAANAPRPPQFLEHLVDVVLGLFDMRTSGNTPTHYAVAAVFLIGAFIFRKIVTTMIFAVFRRLAKRTRTTLDDKLFPALEGPVKAYVSVFGIVAALRVLKLSVEADQAVAYGSTIAFSLVTFWFLLRAFNTLLDHAQEVATQRKMGVAAFMPWIKKTLIVVFFIFGVLMVAQSLGADVKAFLAGLGIGGLAFALAAQDTLANLFGSVVVAIDQPFKLGEFVRIGGNAGLVEDIGLRSTKLRGVDKSLTVVPNKTVAGEVITNLSRFTQRRTEQVIGLTYDTKPSDMDAMVAEIKAIILAEKEEIDVNSVMVFFRDFSASSLDIWVVYMSQTPDFQQYMRLRQRINLAIMRAVEARGLSFAFPTQTVHFDGEIARSMARSGANPPPQA